MQSLKQAALVATVATLGAMSIPVITSAAPVTTAAGAAIAASRQEGSPIEQVQWRRRNYGGAVAGGFIGGLLLGGLIASQPPVYYYPAYPAPRVYVPAGDPIAYCMQRFKSYDPYSMTYLGFDGLRHRCP